MDNNDVWGTYDTQDGKIQKGFCIELPSQTFVIDEYAWN